MSAGSVIAAGIGMWATMIVVALVVARTSCRIPVLSPTVAPILPDVADPHVVVPSERARDRDLTLLWLSLSGAAVIGAALASDGTQWRPVELVVLLAILAAGSELLALEVGRLRISAAFMATILAAALLGPAPAVMVGALCAVSDAARLRHARSFLASKLAAFAVVALAAGLAFDALGPATESSQVAWAAAIVAVFVLANTVHAALLAGHVAAMRRASLAQLLRTAYVPILPWQLGSAVVAAAAVLGAERYGIGLIGLLAVGIGVHLLGIKAVIDLQAAEPRRGGSRDASMRHERMLRLMLHTLSLRDPSAARHAAAVAHYARHLARTAGLGPHEQEVAHTAGLLHDIGKQSLPDAILNAEHELTDDERHAVERHPLDGARLVREIPGLEQVADAVLAHHERPDGSGYPRRLRGAEIPRTAQVLAIAEAYDVLTAPDSYRRPMTVSEALEELRRCAGSQFDAALVETFAATITELGGAGFRRRGDADLESELRLQRGARELLGPQPSGA